MTLSNAWSSAWSRQLPTALMILALLALLAGCGGSEEAENLPEQATAVGSSNQTSAVLAPTPSLPSQPDESTNTSEADVAPPQVEGGSEISATNGQAPAVESQSVAGTNSDEVVAPGNGLPARGMTGGPGMPENFESVQADHDTLLAAALGMSVEDLQAARQRVMETAMPQAPNGGQQAPPAGTPDGGRQAPPAGGNMPPGGFGNAGFDMQGALAEDLGINVEDFKTADATAWSTALAQAVADGRLTQAEADTIAAMMQNPS